MAATNQNKIIVMGTGTLINKALIAYYREVAERTRETMAGTPEVSDLLSLRVAIGKNDTTLVELLFPATPENREFYTVVLTGIERYCVKRMQELEAAAQVAAGK